MERLTVFCLFITNKVKKWHTSLSSELMNEFTLPEQHNMLLAFLRFFLFTKEIKLNNVRHSFRKDINRSFRVSYYLLFLQQELHLSFFFQLLHLNMMSYDFVKKVYFLVESILVDKNIPEDSKKRQQDFYFSLPL